MLMPHTEVVGLAGDARLERVRWRNRKTGRRKREARDPQRVPVHRRRSRHRLARRLRRRDRPRRLRRAPAGHCALDGDAASPLKSSVPGVFAVGDVRSGSVKRVGGAIGEGAQVVAALHALSGGSATSSAVP